MMASPTAEAWLMMSTPSTSSTAARKAVLGLFIGCLGGVGPTAPQRNATTMAAQDQVAEATARPDKGMAMKENTVEKMNRAPAKHPHQLQPMTIPPSASCSTTENRELMSAPIATMVLKTTGSGARLQ